MAIWQDIEAHITSTTGQAFHISNKDEMGGGCISATSRISDGESTYFLKTNQASFADMFEAEAQGLTEMAASNTIKVPEPICFGVSGNQTYVVMEYLNLSGRADAGLLGQHLAAMHAVTSEQFGWYRNNTIGSTPQRNTQSHNWCEFWQEHRLGYQLRLAGDKGYSGKLQALGERLLSDLPILFETYQPEASMLHGDLWSGNYGGLADGVPVIFDPAFYYGDREADLAMTTLFGGFSPDFYASYNDVMPLDDGYTVRKEFYNIYHIINHLNLFGGGYQSQAINMLQRVLAEL